MNNSEDKHVSPLDVMHESASEVVATLMKASELTPVTPPSAELVLEAALNLQKLGLLEISRHSGDEAVLEFNAMAKETMLAELKEMPNLEDQLSPVSFVTAFSLWLVERRWDRFPPAKTISLRQFLAMVNVLTTCLRQKEEQLPPSIRHRLA